MSYSNSHLDVGSTYDLRIQANAFDAYMARQEGRILSALLPRLYPAGVSRYLDFACGTGRITSVIAPMAETSVGVDVSESMLEQAREKCPRTRFYCLDITGRSVPEAAFDLITSFRFFGNAEDALRRRVLPALASLLAPGGYLIVNNHRNPWTLRGLLGKARGEKSGLDLNGPKFRRLLAEAGLEIAEKVAIGVWIVRDRWMGEATLNSKLPRFLEPLSSLPGASLIAPDTVWVVQRRR